MKPIFCGLFVWAFFQHSTLKAHPVGYGNSLSLISYNSQYKNRYIIHYSPTYWWSYGIENSIDSDKKIILPRLGFLAKRWNSADTQANIYFFAGLGTIEWDLGRGRDRGLYHVGTQWDWESRRYFVMARYSRYEGDDLLEENYTGRLGFAPYLAKYDELNTWFMLQASEESRSSNQRFSILPLIRMFYKNILWEVGSDTRQNWHFNFSIRQFI